MSDSQMTHDAENARHYGNMQFAMFTVFTTICGALMGLVFSEGGRIFVSIPCQRVLFSACGMVLSLYFIIAQARVTYLIHFYQEKAFSACEGDTKPNGHEHWKFIAHALVLPYLMTLAFWFLVALNVITVNVLK